MIAFVTGNDRKFATAAEHLARQGIAIEHLRLDLNEIQSNAVSDVALHKANQAHGIAHIADLTEKRECRFVSALVFVDRDGALHTFGDEGEPGRIAVSPAAEDESAWSELWRINVAAGTSAPLSALTGEERADVFNRWSSNSVFARLAEWLTSRRDQAGSNEADWSSRKSTA